MPCDHRIRLDKAHAEAGCAFDAARAVLQQRIGITPREEYLSYSDAVDAAWKALLDARAALDAHIRAHGCEANGEAQTA
jgi:hypothetical protein